ncbi:MAG: sulfatase [Bryobacteraceae bacterium]
MLQLNRREFLGALGAAAAPDERTNVLLIISDQFHHSVMGAAGHPVVKTPNLDRIAREGVRFDNAVCATPFCSPSRATIMTGIYPHAHGITYNVGNPERGLDPKLGSTENTLFAAGYACAQRGKWHLGEKARIPAYAKDGDVEYKEGRRREVVSTPAVKKAVEAFGDRTVIIGRTERPAPENVITDAALEQMRALAGKPFFLTVSLPAPHAPWAVAEPYYSMYERARIPLPANRGFVEEADRETPARRLGELLGEEGLREYLGVYYGMVSMVDWNVGRLLEGLRRLNLERNTLVIFVSDHGDMQAGHMMYGKITASMFEETTRIALLMRLPGRIPAGRVVRTQAGHADLRPTILDYLGFPAPERVHGRSLRSVIDGREDLARPMFCERERGPKNFQRVIRTLEWKYCYSSSGNSQLYDLGKDPGETRNVIGEAGAVRGRLHATLRAWMQETGDPRAAAMENGGMSRLSPV